MAPISEEKFKSIIENAPADMLLPMYFGKKDGVAIYKDLKDMKSVAMFGNCGISGFCNMIIYSMILGRAIEFKFNIPVSVCTHIPSLVDKSDPIVYQYIRDSRVGLHSLIYAYQDRKKASDIGHLVNSPKVYIFDGYCGVLQKDFLEGSKIDIAEAQEALENAYKYGLYVIVHNNIRTTNTLADSIHTRVKMDSQRPNISIEDEDGVVDDINCGWIEYETYKKLSNDDQWAIEKRMFKSRRELFEKAKSIAAKQDVIRIVDLQRELKLGYRPATSLIQLLKHCNVIDDSGKSLITSKK